MSGISGFLRLDGRRADPERAKAMHEALAHRGPDGEGIWVQGSVALAQQRLGRQRGPEDVMPKTDRWGRTLTGDLRLDNREELAVLLGISSGSLAVMGDAELTLRAYDRWGVGCAEKLQGDFAFVLWDDREQRLFCARDPFGVKPFFYAYLPGKIFAFASELRSLFYLSEISRDWNEEAIADFIVFSTQQWPSTFFRDIQRLNPAHTVVITDGCMHFTRYWMPEPAREIHYRDDQEYAQAFLEIFKHAVRVRLDGKGPAGAFLSGGLDSSSIVCVARKLLLESGATDLHTFSAMTPGVPQADETEFVQAVLDQGRLKAHLIRTDQNSPLEGFEELLEHACQPVWVPNHYTHWLMYREARQQGVHFILDGFGGDAALFQGAHYFAVLLVKGQWREFFSELKALHEKKADSLASIFWNMILRPLAPYPLKKAWILLRRGGRVPQEIVLDTLLDPNFLKRVRIRERIRENAYRKMKIKAFDERFFQGYVFEKFSHQISMEGSGVAAALCQIEPRYPFLDRRLVEYCLALPPSQKLHQGWTRIVMRRAMQGLLPSRVQWRIGKGHVNYGAYQGFARFEREALEKTFSLESLRRSKYLRPESVHELLQRFLLVGDLKHVILLWLVYLLLLWQQKIQALLPVMPKEEGSEPMEKANESKSENKKTRKPYAKPEITSFGTVNEITKGMFGGDKEGALGDS